MAERQVTAEGSTYPLPGRSTSSPRRTRSSTRAPTRCPRRSSTGSWCGSRSATPTATPRTDVLLRRLARRQEAASGAPRRRRGDAARDAGGRRGRRRWTGTSCGTASTSRPRPARTARSRSGRPRAGRRRCCSSPARSPCCPGGDFVTPEDVKAVAVPGARAPADAHARGVGARVSAPQEVVADVLARARHGPDAARRPDDLGAPAGGGGRRRPPAALLLALALLAGRADVAVLGVAAVVAGLRAAPRVPSVGPRVRPGGRGRSARPAATLRPTGGAPAAAEAVGLRVAARPPLRRGVVRCRSDGTARDLPLTVHSVRTGPRSSPWSTCRASGPARRRRSPAGPATRVRGLGAAAARALGVLPLPPRLRGSTGAHGSRRPGDGGDLRDVHPFAPGDRLRRIDWRVTARRAPDLDQLYVRRDVRARGGGRRCSSSTRATTSARTPRRGAGTARAAGRRDVARPGAAGRRVGGGGATSTAGDRVGLEDLGGAPPHPAGGRPTPARPAPARTGPAAPRGRPAAPAPRAAAPLGQPGLCSSPRSSTTRPPWSRQWRRAGHRVVAVDVLPPCASVTSTTGSGSRCGWCGWPGRTGWPSWRTSTWSW